MPRVLQSNALNAKFAVGFVVAAGAGNATVNSPVVNMVDAFSYALAVRNYHPTLAATVVVKWYVDPALTVLVWQESFTVRANQDVRRITGPAHSLYCKITGTVPRQGGTTTQFDVFFFGLNRVMELSQSQTDSQSAIPGNRDNISLLFTNLTSTGVAEASRTADISVGPAYAALNASSYTVPAGKVLRFTRFRHAMVASAAVLHTFRIRLTTALTGNLIFGSLARIITAGGTVNTDGTITDGLEFPEGTVLQFSIQLSVANTGGSDLNIDGILYDA